MGITLPPDKLHAFLRKAAYYRSLDRYDRDEREYKIRLAHDLRRAAEAIRLGSDPDLLSLQAAIKSRDDNLIHWRDQAPFLAWVKADPAVASVSLVRLWDTSQAISPRLQAFSAILAANDIAAPGAQLIIASTLLMVVSPYDNPPVRTKPFQSSFRDLDQVPMLSSDSLAERHQKAMQLLDGLVFTAPNLLRDRLDAQSVIWCVQSLGWGPVPDDFDPAAAGTLSSSDTDQDTELGEVAPTERLALVQARRGQGRFRDELWLSWGSCAVTSCRTPRLVHAAHIKPWKQSTNAERLDPCNGLLLLPNLHAALDAGLISFADDGLILISETFPSKDAAAAGIHSKLRLTRVPERTQQYLATHRSTVFKRD